MTTTADLVVLTDGTTWTLQAETDQAFEWLRRVTGAEDRTVYVDPVEGRELCLRARTDGLVVNAEL